MQGALKGAPCDFGLVVSDFDGFSLFSGILSLPLEILSVVCENLDLQTVFHISRTSKAFYRFLRNSPAQIAIWDTAREASGLPALTAFSSIQSANLLFGNCAVRSCYFPSSLLNADRLLSAFLFAFAGLR